MPDIENPALEDTQSDSDTEDIDLDTESSEDSDTDSDAQQPDRIALLEQQVAALATQNTKLVRDFSAAVGRYQSLQDKLESGKGDTDKLTKQLAASLGAVETALDTILNDESVDPALRQKAQEAKTKAKAQSEIDDLKAQMEALKTAPKEIIKEIEDDSNDLSPLERVLNTMIVKAGFHPTRDFDWGEASQVFTAEGEDGVIGYFTTKISEKLAEAQTTSRRQARKDTASRTPNPASAARTPEQKLGDDTLSLDERLATLRAMISNRV